jgi:hypothetical protein
VTPPVIAASVECISLLTSPSEMIALMILSSNKISLFNSYTQETPTRFKKDIIRAAAGSVSSAEAALRKNIAAQGLQRVLANIGAAERLSIDELQMIFRELGNERGEIPARNFIQLL